MWAPCLRKLSLLEVKLGRKVAGFLGGLGLVSWGGGGGGLSCLPISRVLIYPWFQFLDINFDYDSIKKQYTPSTTPVDEVPRHGPALKLNPSPSSPLWTYDDRIADSSTGYQLSQLCRCYYTTVPSSDSVFASNHTPSPTNASVLVPSETSGTRMPVDINAIQYSVAIGL